MKNIVLILLIFAVTSTFAIDFNSEVSNNANIKTKVIKPFQVSSLYHQCKVPAVIKGQIRNLSPDEYITFFMCKESGYTVSVDMEIPDYPVNGVKLVGNWYYLEYLPVNGENLGTMITPRTFNWDGNQSQLWLSLKIDKVDARLAIETKLTTFEIKVSGNYINL